MMRRSVEPEWLDHLAAQDPRALRSRRDLRRLNAIMANARLIARELRRVAPAGFASIAEIGAGDGTFLAKLAHALHGPTQVEATLVDCHDLVRAETLADFSTRGWKASAVQADIFEWLEREPRPAFDVVIANLFLHHFDSAALVLLLERLVDRTAIFIACEPRRSAWARLGARLVGVVGCSEVTRHDALASVRAGFCHGEISALWPKSGGWTLEEGARGWFSHCFIARRPR